MRLGALNASVVMVSLVSGCATSYAPESGPRISVVMSGGTPAYHKNGKTYSHGFAGSGLVDVVEDDPEAKQAAETYHERSVGGLIAVLGGLACGVAGVAVLSSGRDDRGSLDSQQATIGGAALVCMLGATITGLVLIATAQPYQWDAINLYNDHVEQRLRMLRCSPQHCPPPWPAGYGPPPLAPPPSAPQPPPPPATETDAGAAAE
jgi:hypothetical protein